LVPRGEGGRAGSGEAEAAVGEYVGAVLTEGAGVRPAVDTLLRGCTHYPFLRARIEKVAGAGVRVVDSATTTALAVREVLSSHRLVRGDKGALHEVHATGSRERFAAIARRLFGEDVPVHETTL